jgi:hypothetical protein
MNMNIKISKRHLQIDKAQTTMFVAVGVAVAVTIFCLISAKALLSQAIYQHKVISQRQTALKQLKTDASNAKTLVDQYHNVFEGSDAINIIGGKRTNDANATPPDGSNSRIVLDSLPTSFDFPALLTSLSKMMADAGVNGPQVNGTDDPGMAKSTASAAPTPVPITVAANASGNYSSVKKLVNDFERSVRPFDITSISLSGDSNVLNMSVQLTTYYQPATTFAAQTKGVK